MPRQLPLPHKERPQRVPLKGVPQIPDTARMFFLRDIQPPSNVEAECDTAINEARVEITKRYHKYRIERLK